MSKDSKKTSQQQKYLTTSLKQSSIVDNENLQLRDEILALHSYMHKREKQHKNEIDQLKKQNKHFANQIMRLQQQLSKSKNKGIIQEPTMIDLKSYIHKTDNEIMKRQQRQILLLEDNEQLRGTIECLRQQIQRMSNQRQVLINQMKEIECSNINLLQQKRNSELLQSSELNQIRLKSNLEISNLKKDLQRLRQQNQGIRKDNECLLALMDQGTNDSGQLK